MRAAGAADRLTREERIPFARTVISHEAQQAAARVLASGWVTSGPEVGRFEEEFAARVSARHAVAVSSCTAAIEIALRALHLRPGAKVLTPTLTFCGAVNAVVHAGLSPVLVDVDPATLMPDPDAVAAAASRAAGADAMVALHFAGHPAPVEALADAAGLGLAHVIEDAAHGLPASAGERPVGSISAATCFSFYATKNLPIGEGGMITTADDDVAAFARRARLNGMSRDAWRRHLPGGSWRYSVEEAGLKANMTDVQAVIGRAQLRHLEQWQRRRERIVARYDRGLRAIRGLRLPARPGRGRHAWHLYVVRVTEAFGIGRDALIAALAERGIDTSVHFIPVHQMPYYRGLVGRDAAAALPAADAASEEIVSLPLYPSMTDAQVDRVCAAIASLQRGGAARAAATTQTTEGS